MLTRDSCVVEVVVNLARFCPVQDSHAGSDFRLGVVRANFLPRGCSAHKLAVPLKSFAVKGC